MDVDVILVPTSMLLMCVEKIIRYVRISMNALIIMKDNTSSTMITCNINFNIPNNVFLATQGVAHISW